jgi:hypothetical protein
MLLLLTLLLLTIATPALAVDGVLEINQTCAVQTGCFAGDTAGFPVSITTPGSYLLTSNLVVPDANTTAIKQLIDFALSIDLNGFQISPPNCGNSCKPESASEGVKGIWGGNGVTVKNGTIAGMGGYGIYLGAEAEVKSLTVRWNSGTGIYVAGSSNISGNIVSVNGFAGISSGQNSNISSNVFSENLGGGIYCALGCTITQNSLYNNGRNGSWGIQAGFGSAVSGNTVRTPSTGSWGLRLGDPNVAYRDNTITTTTGATGTVTGGVNAGGNVCNGSLTCP